MRLLYIRKIKISIKHNLWEEYHVEPKCRILSVEVETEPFQSREPLWARVSVNEARGDEEQQQRGKGQAGFLLAPLGTLISYS